MEIDYESDNVFETFELSDEAEIPVGYYDFFQLEGSFNTPMTRPLWLRFHSSVGGYYDGSLVNLYFTPSWSLSSSLMLSGAYIYSNVKLPDRNQQFLSHIGRLKTLIMFNTRLSLSAFIQYNSEDQNIGSNVRFRYNPREGNDLWLVYNEGTNNDLERHMPELPMMPRMNYRSILLKYTKSYRCHCRQRLYCRR